MYKKKDNEFAEEEDKEKVYRKRLKTITRYVYTIN